MHNGKACPSDEMLMDYLENRLPENRRRQVENHLAQCPDCREQVAVFTDLLSLDAVADTPPVPEPVTQRAVDAVRRLTDESRRRSWVNRASQWVGRGISRGMTMLDRLSLRQIEAPVLVRGKADALIPPLIRREKVFGDLKVTVEIEKSDADQAMIRVTGVPLQESTALVRVALFCEDREVASTVLGGETVFFEEIPIGRYILVFARQTKTIGEYAFEITDHT